MSVLTADRLVINQKPKLIELTNQFLIRDAEGNDLGYVQQEGQSTARKVLRFVTKVDQFLTHQLAIHDADGTLVARLTRPAKVFKSRVLVEDGRGREVGQILQKNVFGKIRFDLVDSQERKLGEIRAENWRAWDFAIVDTNEREIGRIDKKFVGVAKAIFTTADNYVVDIAGDVEGDLRLMVVAAASAVDTALKQDDRGFSLTGLIDG